MLTDEFLRVIIQDREREVQRRLRERRHLGPIQPSIRWFNRGRHLEDTQPPGARGR